MQYNPKLKKAIEEIKAILQRHDIAGFVVLHTPMHAEYLLRIDPSYSCAKFEGQGVRIKAKAADFNGNAELRNQRIKETSNMLHQLSVTGGNLSLSLMDVSEQLDRAVQADHESGGHTSHNTQNN